MNFPEYYQEGFDAGYRAGFEGQSSDPVKSYGWLNMAYFAFKSKEEREAFLSGWDKGYEQGVKDKSLA